MYIYNIIDTFIIYICVCVNLGTLSTDAASLGSGRERTMRMKPQQKLTKRLKNKNHPRKKVAWMNYVEHIHLKNTLYGYMYMYIYIKAHVCYVMLCYVMLMEWYGMVWHVCGCVCAFVLYIWR